MARENLSFEHFNPQLELCSFDENGRSIRPRKKPGRKPNPPTPTQRKAQNRAAQRAFRERKRREMREAESNAKRYLYARNQALRKLKKLQRRIDELIYETNYLKGYVLTLKLACVANQVEVPKFWDTGSTDEVGADTMTFSRTKGIPQQLELFLDKHLNIISIDQQQQPHMSDMDLSLSSILRADTGSSSSGSASVFSDSQPDDYIPDETLSSIAPQLASHLESTFFQKLLETDLVDTRHLEDEKTSTTNKDTDDDCMLPIELQEDDDDDDVIDAKTGLVRTVTLQTDIEDTRSISSQQQTHKRIYPPMTPMDAIKELRAAKHRDENTRALFTPTELQRHIRHDTRIDVIPDIAFRDHMILFQDFYNANELFDYIIESAVFLGGELGNIDAWFVPPKFFKKYWFLCPNHKHKRMDNAVEVMVQLNKKMIELMARRKQMYIERDLYSDYFPTPTEEQQQAIDHAFLQKGDEQHLKDILMEKQQQQADVDDIEYFLHDDINGNDLNNPDELLSVGIEPLDHFINMLNRVAENNHVFLSPT